MANIDDKRRHPGFAATPTGTRPIVVIDSPLEFSGAQAGAPSTAALLSGGGTSTTRITTATANKNFLGYWVETTATSGDTRGMYIRLYFSGAGVSGEALRAYGTVNGVQAAVGGTVNGAHISLNVTTGGSISGAGHALRATYEIAASTTPGGTVSVLQLDSSFGASAVPGNTAYISTDNIGAAPTTNGIKYLLQVTNPNTDSMFVAAGTGAGSAGNAGGAVATHALLVRVGSTDYWIPLCNTNAS